MSMNLANIRMLQALADSFATESGVASTPEAADFMAHMSIAHNKAALELEAQDLATCGSKLTMGERDTVIEPETLAEWRKDYESEYRYTSAIDEYAPEEFLALLNEVDRLRSMVETLTAPLARMGLSQPNEKA